MLKTLKGKITLIYLFLVAIIAIIGITSVLNLYSIGNMLNGFILDNYNSINSSNLMLEAVEEEDSSLIKYLYSGNMSFLDNYNKNNDIFLKWYDFSSNNVTEKGEMECINNINTSYKNLQNSYSKLIKLKDSNSDTEALTFYNSNIIQTTQTLKLDIKKLKEINENSLFKKRSSISKSIQQSLYIILFMSFSLALIGIIVSIIFTSRFLKPVEDLKKSLISLKEGHYVEAAVVSNDEIGELTREYNSLILKLKEFENSSKGILMEEKEKSLAIIRSISDPLIVLDNDFKIILLNNAFERFFDVKNSQAVSKHFLEIVHNYDIFNHIESVLKTNNNKHVLKIISLSLNDKLFYFDVSVTPIYDNNSYVKGVVIVFQNVTQLKKLDKAKSDFISAVSHEFKTPLTSITMGISLLNEPAIGDLNSKQLEIINSIKEGSDNLSQLIINLIQLSKIESDSEIFNIQPCSIFGIIDGSIKNFISLANKKQINLYHDLDENLPKVMADSEKITWVLNNLISNSLKFTNVGDEIWVGTYIDDNFMQIFVKDTGIGIPKQYLETIFDKFVKVSNSNSENNGSGLGLTVSKKIVDAHGGKIWCESEVDMGSSFTFTLPLAE